MNEKWKIFVVFPFRNLIFLYIQQLLTGKKEGGVQSCASLSFFLFWCFSHFFLLFAASQHGFFHSIKYWKKILLILHLCVAKRTYTYTSPLTGNACSNEPCKKWKIMEIFAARPITNT
jgi:hypothetical protein